MPIVKGKSKTTGLMMLTDKAGKISLDALKRRYLRIIDLNKGHQKLQEENAAPIRIKTKARSEDDKPYYIYFHPHLEKRKVLLYEELYAKLEHLVNIGKLKYNPLVTMLFKETKIDKYFGVASHAGEPLVKMYSHLKDPIATAKQIIDIYNLFRSLGYEHGHLHDENVCIDNDGKVKIIDISKFVRSNENNNSLLMISDIIYYLCLAKQKVNFDDPSFDNKIEKLSDVQKNVILSDMKELMCQVDGMDMKYFDMLANRLLWITYPNK